MNRTCICVFCMYAFMQVGLAQTGPGGVGTSGGGSNLNIWFDANQQAYTSGSTLATNGQTVESWRNLGLASGSATASSSSFRPTFTESGLNGYPTLTFDGSNDSFNFALTTTSSGTLFAVASGSFPSGTARVLIRLGEPSLLAYSNSLRMTSATNMRARLDNGLQIGNINQTITSGTTYLWSYNHRSIGSSQLYSNGSSSGTNSLAISLGATGSTTSVISGTDFWDGEIAEIIHFSSVINTAKRIIIENYLAAKYGLTLSSNDIYNEDDGGNGNYDHDVAGIGQASNGTNHTDSRGTGMIRILSPSNLGNSEFLFWGHDNGDAVATEISDVPSGVEARFDRVWRVSEQGDVGTVNIRFDLSAFTSVTTTELRLIIDTDNDGLFNDETPISGATDLGGGIYQFASISALQDNLRFTIGSADKDDTPLPITLVSFDATLNHENVVDIKWVTLSETDNSHFTIERSENGIDFEALAHIDGAGDSEQIREYSFEDNSPINGTSYYRLKQTDFNGQYSYSDIKQVKLETDLFDIIYYPNPIAQGANLKFWLTPFNKEAPLLFSIINAQGMIKASYQISTPLENGQNLELPTSSLSSGVYFVQLNSNSRLSKRIIIK